MSVDSSELDELAHDFGLVPGRLVKKVRPIMNRTGLAMKKRMQADVRRSKHFRGKNKPGLDASIDYDVKASNDGIAVEVGPNPDRNPAAGLARIAYFGGSNGGGGTVPDPIIPMRQEEPVLLGYLQMAVEDLL